MTARPQLLALAPPTVASFSGGVLDRDCRLALTNGERQVSMKIKVTNTPTIELPDDLDPETSAALFEAPGLGSIDDADVEEEHDEDASTAPRVPRSCACRDRPRRPPRPVECPKVGAPLFAGRLVSGWSG